MFGLRTLSKVCEIYADEFNAICITTRLNEYHPTRTLRNCEEEMLVVQKTNLHYGDITFSVSAAKLWNSIPLNLKCA